MTMDRTLDEICFINYGLKAYQEGKGKPSQTRQDVNLKAFYQIHKLIMLTFLFGRGKYY